MRLSQASGRPRPSSMLSIVELERSTCQCGKDAGVFFDREEGLWSLTSGAPIAHWLILDTVCHINIDAVCHLDN